MRLILILAAALTMTLPALRAQYKFFTPKGSYTVEVSLDNSPYLRLPIYRNAITSLAVVGDYAIGGTSANAGLSPYVFAVALSRRKLEMVLPLEKVIAGQRSIRSGFGRGPNGLLYAGTMPDKEVQVKNGKIDVADLGVPVPGEGIFALTADTKRGSLYGISHPSGNFFVFHAKDRSAEVYTETSGGRRTVGYFHQYAVEPEDYLSRRLIVDQAGRVYGSQPINKVFRFDPATKKIEVLQDELPDVWGRRPLGRVDAWAVAPDGTLYGGNAGDGQLFTIDPATGKIKNLGKPIMMPRLKGLAFGSNGVLYGVAGGAPGYTHLFTYKPDRGFVDLGNPRFVMVEPGIEQGIDWRGFQIGTLTASEDGRYIVMGEEEALSQLMVFPAE
jgi:hypothetical protein